MGRYSAALLAFPLYRHYYIYGKENVRSCGNYSVIVNILEQGLRSFFSGVKELKGVRELSQMPIQQVLLIMLLA